MQIWIANPFDEPPGPGVPRLRYWALAETLAAQGHAVVWWTADWSHLHKAPRAAPDATHPFALRLIPVRPYRHNLGLARLLSHRDYARGFRAAGEAAVAGGELPPPEVVVASLPPLETLVAVAEWKTRWGTRLCLDIMDAWPENFERLLPRWLPPPLRRLPFLPLKRKTVRAFRIADRISAVGTSYLELAHPHAPGTPLHLCYHGAEAFPEPRTAPPDFRERPLRLLHLGALNRGYDLFTPLEALTLPGGESLELHYAGTGTCAEALRRRVRRLGLEKRVVLHGQLGREALTSLMNRCHAGIVSNRTDSWVACPYKAADYAAAGLPMLSGLGGEFAGLLREHRLGETYAEGDPADFLRALRRLCERPPGGLAAAALSPLFNRAISYPAWADFLTAPSGA